MHTSKPPIYLFSKTSYDDSVKYIPILKTTFYDVNIDFSAYDLIVATSKQIFGALDSIDKRWRDVEVIAISEPTALEAKKFGANVVDIVSGYGVQLLEKISKEYGDRKILYPRAKVVATSFSQDLRDLNVDIKDSIIYETTCNDQVGRFELDERAVLIFTSPSSVKCFEKHFTFCEQQILVSIGTTTKKALPRDKKIYIPDIPSLKASVELAKTLQK